MEQNKCLGTRKDVVMRFKESDAYNADIADVPENI